MSDLIASHIKAILFDHDDTLVATIEAKWAQHKHIARIYYGKTLHDEELREHWGKPLRVLAGLLYGTDDIETAMSHIQKTHHDFPKKLHDDTIATLQALHATSMKIGVITATSRSSFDFDMQHMGFPKDLIDYVQTEEDTQFHKPDPRVFEPTLAWLKRNSIEPFETLYVGDGLHDMKAALGAGFEFIGVETGLITQASFAAQGATSIKKLSDLISKS